MTFLQRLWIAIRAIARGNLRDLFGEDDAPALPGDRRAAGVDELRYRVDALLPDIARLVQDEQRAAGERRLALDEAERLEGQIDAAIQSGDDERARSLLGEQQRLSQRAVDLEARSQSLSAARAHLQDEMKHVERDLAEIRRRQAEAETRQRSAEALANLEDLQREARRTLAQSAEDLARREEQAAQAEDRLAARRDLGKRR